VVVLLSAGTVVLVAGAALVLDSGLTALVEVFTSEVVVTAVEVALEVALVEVALVDEGVLVLEAVLQSKETVGTLMLQLGLGLPG